MSIFHKILGGAAGQGAGGFTIERSLRFNNPDSAYLSRTYGSGNNRKFTVSAWVKRTPSNSSEAVILGCRQADSDRDWFGFESDELVAHHKVNNTVRSAKVSNRKFRDFSAWYHIVYAFNSTLSNQNDRTKFYVNGERQTVSTYNGAIGSNENVTMNLNNVPHYIGVQNLFQGGFTDFLLAEVHFVDSQELDADDFGEYDDNNVWQPKKYEGTYGTTGWYLDFADNSSTTALGYDAAGSNNWTPNNFSVTTGVGNDSLIDTPTNYVASSGNNGGNYCTMNPLTSNGAITFRNGHLDTVNFGGTQDNPRGTIAVSSGKWYWECEITAFSGGFHVGIATTDSVNTGFLGNNSGEWAYVDSGNKYAEGTQSGYGSSFASVGKVISVVFDADAGTLTFWLDGTSQGQAFSGLTDGPYLPAMYARVGTTGGSWNFGQRPFKYTPPSGYKSLCTTNLPDPTIDDPSTVFDVTTHSGTGSAQSISSLAFSPDLVWIKKRSGSPDQNHSFHDTIRGSGRTLLTNDNGADFADSQGLTSFNSNGFSIGTQGRVNENGGTYVAWNWDAGTSTSTNTNGSINSSVRVNQNAGFSIVSWTGNGQNATIGHSLNAVPQLIILKDTDTGRDWYVGTPLLGGSPWLKYLTLNGLAIPANNSDIFQQGGQPTSSVFGVGAVGNPSGSNIAYCFTPVEGYSAFGTYAGNGNANGPFVFTGFKPRFIIIRRFDSQGDWRLFDTERDSFNVSTKNLFANLSDSEGGSSSITGFDILSNGFKFRASHSALNSSSGTYLYFAFAEHPFKYARAR